MVIRVGITGMAMTRGSSEDIMAAAEALATCSEGNNGLGYFFVLKNLCSWPMA